MIRKFHFTRLLEKTDKLEYPGRINYPCPEEGLRVFDGFVVVEQKVLLYECTNSTSKILRCHIPPVHEGVGAGTLSTTVVNVTGTAPSLLF